MIINEFRFFEGRYQGKQYNSNFGAVFLSIMTGLGISLLRDSTTKVTQKHIET